MSLALKGFVTALRPSVKTLTKQDWQGAEHLPDGGFVLAANHVSHLDPLTLAHFCVDNHLPPRYLAKASILDFPVLGRLIRTTQQIPVYRGTATAAEAFSAAVEAVEEGGAVIIYPEGTITRDPDLWPMAGKTGAARVALTTGCPVVPVAQWGAQEVLAPYTAVPHVLPRKTMHVNVGPPVDLDDLRGRPIDAAVLAEATTRIMDTIAGLLGEIRGETPPPTRMTVREIKQRAAERAKGDDA
ncbi:lysophospholipid acyltransferase family protein [Solicola sp. PLA-1-18]|uniref:lysophospholipid acyltransferase family protein n=1 Tax=Solicola sp. PLA-1-18 TaxID=3380532 RepID=UPI003B78A9F8